MRDNTFMQKLGQSPTFRQFVRNLAFLAAASTVVGLVLRLSGMTGGDALLIAGMGSLAVVSVLLAFAVSYPAVPDNAVANTKLQPLFQFAAYLVFLALAVLLMGLLFLLMSWPGGLDMLLAGGLGLIVGLATLLYYRKQREKFIENKKI